MSIIRSLYSAVGGLGAHSQAIGVVSDNIANMNTIGFKASRGRFADVLSSTNGDGIGQGTQMAGVDALFTQGALLATGVNTDLAIAGDGFFLVNGAFNGVNGSFFTRNGQFNVDGTGKLVTADGLVVQGYSADTSGNIGSTVGDIEVSTGATEPAEATTEANFGVQLDANAAATSTTTFDPNNSATYNYSTSVTVYDSLGNAHSVDVYFRKSGAGTWEWRAMTDLTGTGAAPTEIASGTNLTFDGSGALDGGSNPPDVSITFANADAQTIDLTFTGSTSFAADSTPKAISANGATAGSLSGMSIGEDGTITGSFTNGKTRALGKIALARFANSGGLQRVGSGLYSTTAASGQALVGGANSGGRGAISSGALEQSNVDLVQEFVNLIAYQRGFQANSRTITTADEMLADLVNIKR